MAQATGSRRRIVYGPETVAYGTVATTGTILRNTGDSLNLSKNAITSSELSSDRAIKYMRHGNQTVGGDISAELAYGAYDDLLAAAIGGTWALDVLKQGLVVPPFSIEKGFMDLGIATAGVPAGLYEVFRGCVVNTLGIEIASDALVTASFGIIGAGTDGFIDTPMVATPAPVVISEPFTSFEGTISINGVETCIITALSLSVDNGITANYALCSPEAQGVTAGRVNVTGTITALFEGPDELQKFINEEELTLSVLLQDIAGTATPNTLKIDLPRIKYTGGDVPVDGEGIISISLPFQALYDEVAESAIVITRTAFTDAV